MRRHAILLYGAGALLLAGPAPGDWLVMGDGTRIETSGPWQVKGRQVIFTRPDGTLAALRLADVDLEVSAAATAESQVAMPEPDPGTGSESRQPVLRLTDQDLRPPGPDPNEEDEGDVDEDDEAEPDEDSEAASAEPIRLVSWESGESDDLGGLEITGSVRNTGSGVAAAIRVTVTVLDDEENPYTSRAFLQRSSLTPGASSTFRAIMPGIFTLQEDPTFKVESEGISIQGAAGPDGADDTEGEGGAIEEEAGEPPP